MVKYNVTADTDDSHKSSVAVRVTVLDADEQAVNSTKGLSGVINIPKVQLWWPHSMKNTSYSYLYTLQVKAMRTPPLSAAAAVCL